MHSGDMATPIGASNESTCQPQDRARAQGRAGTRLGDGAECHRLLLSEAVKLHITSVQHFGTAELLEQLPWAAGAELFGRPDESGKRAGFHLAHDVPAVDLNGVLGDPEFRRSLFVH
jgi:hypothetical protein